MSITDLLNTVSMPAFSVRSAARVANASQAPKEAEPSVAPGQPPPTGSHAATLQQVQVAAQEIQRYLSESARTIEFRVDDASGVPVVTVRDASNGEVIRQIPNEEVLHLAQMLKENSQAQHALVSLTA